MHQADQLQNLLAGITQAQGELTNPLARLAAELKFAIELAQAHPDEQVQWEALIEQAAALVLDGLRAAPVDVSALVEQAEQILAPLGQAAKEYTIYCVGHAHIDMNWMWSWPETVALTHDTFATMDKLMDEFPEFRFVQSQASVYALTRQYAPELFQRIKQRVAEGNWEIVASQWVEGDKNLASGEILCRHLLYTRRWFEKHMGIAADQVKIAWEPDTFGHCWTLPGILARGGVSRYYHHHHSGERRASVEHGRTARLFWWQGKDGSRVLTHDDCIAPSACNNNIEPEMADQLLDYERLTGIKDILWVYGVGDHGGGPTRQHLRNAREMQLWPIWPNVKLSTTDEFFSAVESNPAAASLPVHDGELNFVWEGCYSSQSRIKLGNRLCENQLVEAEAVALIAHHLCGIEYPSQALEESWQRAMFIQFHDILPGSGVKDTYEHAMGLVQETLANTGMIRTRGLRALAAKIDTSALACAERVAATDVGLGAGVGSGSWWGGVSELGTGMSGCDPFVVFNPAPFERDEMVEVKIWDREIADEGLVVRNSAGGTVPAQLLARGDYWGHKYAVVAFPANALPPLGYRAYTVEASAGDLSDGQAYYRFAGREPYHPYGPLPLTGPVVLGNEHLEVTVCSENGGIVSIVDKQTGIDFAPDVVGAVQREQEAPHPMTAWVLGPVVETIEPLAGSVMNLVQRGPQVVAVELTAKHNDSEYKLTISLTAGSRRIDFALDVNWLERGDPDTGVPVLRASFPLPITEGRANFEIPCGIIERAADGEEVPALMWADLTGTSWIQENQVIGATLLNDSRYGHRASENELRLTLLRSSYDPDPLPELGQHQIRYALVPHVGEFSPQAAIQLGYGFNHPVVSVGTTVHDGELPPEAGAVAMLTPNVMLTGLKKAEDSDALIIRLYEFAGEQTEARVRLSHRMVTSGAAAVEVDLMEQELAQNSARIEGDQLVVTIPAFGIATVSVG